MSDISMLLVGKVEISFQSPKLQNIYIYIPHGRQPATSSAQEMKTNYLSSQHGIVFLGFYFNDYSQAERLDILSKDAKVVIVDSKEMNKKNYPGQISSYPLMTNYYTSCTSTGGCCGQLVYLPYYHHSPSFDSFNVKEFFSFCCLNLTTEKRIESFLHPYHCLQLQSFFDLACFG